MWFKPWGYKEGFAVCGGLFLVGTLWQALLGKCTLSWLAWPVNMYAGIVYVLLLLALYVFFRKYYFVRWMSSYQAAVSAMISLVLLTVIMGLTRQLRPEATVTGIDAWLGFSQMLSACSFVLLFFWFVTLLGMVILRRMHHLSWRDLPFLLNHLGLFLALTGAVLGSADMQRLEMTTQAGKAEWRALNRQKEILELPLAIELHDFTIDEYPPKLMLIDNESGKALPAGKPENILIEDDFSQGNLLDWEIEVTDKLPMAASVATEDTVKFVEFHSMGATCALYVKAKNTKSNEQHEGWVSCGSFMFPYKALRLNQQVSLIMPDREPRRFASEVTVYTQSGEQAEATVEVNRSFEIDGWKIYQLSYDESKGRWSDISVFELVRDPWLPVVYTGIWMMIAGAVCMFALSHKNKRKEEKE